MKHCLLVTLALLTAIVAYSEDGLSIADLRGFQGLYSEDEILAKIAQEGIGFAPNRENLRQLADAGFSGEFVLKLRSAIAQPKFPALPEYIGKHYRKSENAAVKEIWALIVGINEYANSGNFPKLSYAEADAEGFAKHLLETGVPPQQICLLRGKQVTKRELEKWLEQWRKARGQLYFFYSGHGASSNKTGFHFTCYNSAIDDLDNSGYGMNKLKEQLAQMKGDSSVLFIDACHSGAAKTAVKRKKKNIDLGSLEQEEISVSKLDRAAHREAVALEELQKPVMIITACSADQVAREGKLGHGLFTESLLAGFRGKADKNSDGEVTVREIFDYVEGDVRNRSDFEQRPDYSYSRAWSWDGGGLPLVKEGADFAITEVVAVNKSKQPVATFSATERVYVRIRWTIRDTAGAKYLYIGAKGDGIESIRKRFKKVRKGGFHYYLPLSRTKQQGPFAVEIELRIGENAQRQIVEFAVEEEEIFEPEIEGELDLAALRAKAARHHRERLAWQKYQEKMKSAYDEMQKIEGEYLPGEDKARAWRQFAALYDKDNPHSNDDDAMRSHATTRAKYWDGEKERLAAKEREERERQSAARKENKIRERSTDDRYQVFHNGVIYDTNTELEWYVGPDKDTNHYNAEKYVKNLTVAGGGWRLPSIEELRGIYQKGAGSRNMDPVFKTTGWYVWAGELTFSSSARIFYFYDGYGTFLGRDGSNGGRVFGVRPGRR